MLIVSDALGANTTVRSDGGCWMRQVPFSTPVASVISTQLPVKYAGMSTVRSVTSVAPLLPASAVPRPSDGRAVIWLPVWPLLLMVRLPYVAPGPFR